MVIKGDFTKNPVFAYTQTFRNEGRLYSKKPLGQLRQIGYLFALLSQSCEFQVNVELTNANVIHLHGLLSIHDHERYHNTTFPLLKSYGFPLIKSIDNMDKWLAYCEKNIEEIKVVYRHKLVFPITNINYPQIYSVPKKVFKDIVEWQLEEREISLAQSQALEYVENPINNLADMYHVNYDEYEN